MKCLGGLIKGILNNTQKVVYLCLGRKIQLKHFLSNLKNQIKSLLLSHHHSTSALVSEILMSVLQTVQKNNRQFTYGQTVQKNNKQFPYGQTVQKNNKQFTYGQTVQKKKKNIYIWTDSAKKLHWSIYSAPDSAKKTTAIYIWTDSAKKTTAIYIWTDSAKNNSNLHMDSTYLQTVQKTMCKIHIHILSTLSVL